VQTGTRALIEHEGIRPLEHAQGVPDEEDELDEEEPPPEEEEVELVQIIGC